MIDPYSFRLSFRVVLLFGILLLNTSVMTAQLDLTTHFLEGVYQRNRSNPALLPNHNVVVQLPGIFNNFGSRGITYNDLITENADGETILSIDQALEGLEPDNYVRNNLDVEALSFGIFVTPNVFVQAGYTARGNAYFLFPKELPSLVWNGNAQYIGQEVEVAPDVLTNVYHEIQLGAAVKVNENFTVGGRFKILNGVADISVDRKNFSVFTDDDVYQIRTNADFQVSSTGALIYDEDLEDIELDPENGNFTFENIWTGNNGFAVDLGAQLRLGNLEISASVLDLGNLNWNDNVNNLSIGGVFEFAGLDASDAILSDSLEIGSVIDSLEDAFDVVETNETYTTRLPVKTFLSANYHFSDFWSAGGLLYLEGYRGAFFPALAANVQAAPLHWLTVGGTYSWRYNRFDNLGLNAAVRLGPVQLVAATDNIITAFDPGNANHTNFRFGLNLVFGDRRVGPRSRRNKSYRKVNDANKFF